MQVTVTWETVSSLFISTLSTPVSHFDLREYYFFLLLCGRSRKFENQLFYIKQLRWEGSQRVPLFSLEVFRRKDPRVCYGRRAHPFEAQGRRHISSCVTLNVNLNLGFTKACPSPWDPGTMQIPAR